MSTEENADAADRATLPVDPVSALRAKAAEMAVSAPISSVRTGNRDDIITNARLLGIFPTAEWKGDPTMPDFVDYHDHRIGYYNVAECDVTDAGGTTTGLVLVINAGDGDCNTGYWGGAFERGGRGGAVARFRSVGDMETAVEEEGDGIGGFAPFPEAEGSEEALTFPRFKDGDDEEEEDIDKDKREGYFSGLAPGTCQTQLEKILGVTMERLMSRETNWRSLPKALRNYGKI